MALWYLFSKLKNILPGTASSMLLMGSPIVVPVKQIHLDNKQG